MDILDYENAILAACLVEQKVVRKVALQLSEDRFSEGVTRETYKTILDLYSAGKTVNSLSVKQEISDDEYEGYVDSLLTFLPEHQIMDFRALDSWIMAVDNGGRLRQVGLVAKEYSALFKDYKSLIKEVTDVDSFISDFVGKLRASQQGMKVGYVSIEEVSRDFQKRFDQELRGEKVDRIPTLWENFNAHLGGGVPRGKLIVVCGLPGSGKTQLVLQLLEQLARSAKGCVAFQSVEMQRYDLLKRLAFAYSGLDAKILGNGGYDSQSREVLGVNYQVERMSKLPFYIDDSDFVTSSLIDYQASALHSEKGPLEALAIDYAELVGDKDEGGDSQDLKVSAVFRKAKGLAKTLGCVLFLIAQYSRAVHFSSSKLGANNHIRYAGAAEALADGIWHVYNPYALRMAGNEIKPLDEYPITEGQAYIVVGKDKDVGISSITMGWKQNCALWSDKGLFNSALRRKNSGGEF